jgi:cellulose synthase/poly-beta-1,6-N-acetylglucosamine synthase-like glycosyltransferase
MIDTVPLVMTSAAVLDGMLAALVFTPLLFFAGCALYLWRLLFFAALGRRRVLRLAPVGAGSTGVAADNISIAVQDAPAEAGRAKAGDLPQFAVIIPAHNEELVIASALESIFGIDYPRDAFRVIVVADNCTDRTAAIARGCGAEVYERNDLTAIGKGYALAWMVEHLVGSSPQEASAEVERGSCEPGHAAPPDFDAIVILDADTKPAANLLKAFAERLAQGETAIQARYEVLNERESWRTRLMSCALALAHIVKPLGRERLRLSDGLKGNGMCFARRVVESVPWSGDSITEDIDYTLRLCFAGHRVAFAPETAVWAQMPTTGSQAASQRRRWEQGRYALLTKVAPDLLRESLKRKSAVLFDRAAELIIPPFAEMVAVPLVMMLICFCAARVFHLPVLGALGWGWALLLALFAGYLGAGLWVARIPLSVALTALYAPVYIVWKFGLYGAALLRRSGEGWKRTERRKLDG